MKSNCSIFTFIALILMSCHVKAEDSISSPDKMLIITYKESELHGQAMDWNNTFRFYADGKWNESHENALYSDYYCDENQLKDYYINLQKEEYSEWNPGLMPIRIDQYSLIDGTPVYLVYAETYSEGTWHYFSYTALCIYDGEIKRYPLFRELKESKNIQSEILMWGPASIGLDFTSPSSHNYKFDLDKKIFNAPVEIKINYDSKKKQIIIAGEKYIQLPL